MIKRCTALVVYNMAKQFAFNTCTNTTNCVILSDMGSLGFVLGFFSSYVDHLAEKKRRVWHVSIKEKGNPGNYSPSRVHSHRGVRCWNDVLRICSSCFFLRATRSH